MVIWHTMTLIWRHCNEPPLVVSMTASLKIRKAPFTQGCDLRATFERPEKWSGHSMVAQTQKVPFLCNCCSTTLVPSLNDQSCCSGITGRAKEAEWRQNHCQGGPMIAVVVEWRHSGRHSDLSMDATDPAKEAQWWYKLGRQKRRSNSWYIMFKTVRLYLRGDQWPTIVRPFCDHGDACAFLLPPLSDLWATDLLGDLCATVLNMLKTSRRPWRPWRCMNVLSTTIERPRQPLCLRSAFNSDLTSYVVVQGRHKGRSPCVKGVLLTHGNIYILIMGIPIAGKNVFYIDDCTLLALKWRVTVGRASIKT